MDLPPSYAESLREDAASNTKPFASFPSDAPPCYSDGDRKRTDNSLNVLKGKTPPSFSANDYKLSLRNETFSTAPSQSMIMWCPPPEAEGATGRVEYELEVRTGFDWQFLNVQELTCIADVDVFAHLLNKDEKVVEFLLRCRARYSETCVSVVNGNSVEGAEEVVTEWTEVSVRLEDKRRR